MPHEPNCDLCNGWQAGESAQPATSKGNWWIFPRIFCPQFTLPSARSNKPPITPIRIQPMLRKVFAAFLVAFAFATVAAAVPGLIENMAYACDSPNCD